MSAARQSAAILAVDACTLLVCGILACSIKIAENPELAIDAYAGAVGFILAGCLSTYAAQGLYPGIGIPPGEELRRLTLGTTLAILGAMAFTFLTKSGDAWSRQIIGTAWALALVAVPIARSMGRHVLSRHAWWGAPCLIVGAGATGRRAAAYMMERPWLGLRPAAFLDDDSRLVGTSIQGIPVLGPITASIQDAVRTARAGHALIALPGTGPATKSTILDRLADHVRHVVIAPAMPGMPGIAAETREFAGHLVLEVSQNLLRPSVRVAKRAIDVVVVTGFIMMFWWVLVAIALLIRCSSSGAALYGQTRIGREGKAFTAWKFRSMVSDADARLAAILDADPALRDEWDRHRKLRHDPRITWIGAFLRRTSLDELPQLWNVLRGEMSLVGPRPIVHDEIPRYGEHFALFCKVRPGLSGLWQVSGRSDTGYEERVALDCYYVRSWSIWLDLVIIARTFRVVLLGRGAY